MMKKLLYVIRREDYFEAFMLGQLTYETQIFDAGSIWMTVFLTDEEREKYTTFPICLA